MELIENKMSWVSEELEKIQDKDNRINAKKAICKKLVWSKQSLSLRVTGKVEPTYSEGLTIKKIVKSFLKLEASN